MDGNTILLFYFIDYSDTDTRSQIHHPNPPHTHAEQCDFMWCFECLVLFCCSSISSFFLLISYCVFVCCKNISHCVCIISCIHFRSFVFALRCVCVCVRVKQKIWYDFMCEIDTIRTNKAHQQFYFFWWSTAILIFPRCASLFTFHYCLLPTLAPRPATVCTIIPMYHLSLNQYKLFILPPVPSPAHTHTHTPRLLLIWLYCNSLAVQQRKYHGSGHIVQTIRTNNKINKNVL